MSLAFNSETNWYRCLRCGTKGRVKVIPDYLLRTGGILEKQEVTTFQPPDHFTPLASATQSIAFQTPVNYLASRGISKRIVAEAGIGACMAGKFAWRVVVPIFARKGHTWLGYSARDWTNRSPLRYRYPSGMQRGKILYNAAALDSPSKEPIIAVEGVFDALPYWPHAVAFLGKPSGEQKEMLLETERPIVVVLDGDAWRESWALAERLKLAGKKAAMVRLMPKTDPNSVNRKWLVQEARKAIREDT